MYKRHGKGFAIGSAALTGLALLASYVEEIKIGLLRLGETVLNFTDGRSIEISKASFSDFMVYYDVTLMNPKVLAGMFLGSMMAFMFCGLTMNAVGRAAGHMVEEVRRQFKEIKGILTGEMCIRDRCISDFGFFINSREPTEIQRYLHHVLSE